MSEKLQVVTIIDTETTGFTPGIDACIEVAAVEYSVPLATVLGSVSATISNNAQNEAEHINHIPAAILTPELSRPAHVAWRLVDSLSKRSQAVLAHNSDFDKAWVPTEISLHAIPWIDTCHGVNWPLQSKKSSSLINLALEHGLGVVDPHRALSDCMLIARLITRCSELGHNVQEILERGLRPTALFQALVSYEDKDLAKADGFKWDSVAKAWTRKMAIEDAENLPYKVKRI